MEFSINEENFEHDPLCVPSLYLMQGNSQSIQAVSEAGLNNQDTSFKQSTANNPEVEELQSLLASWNQSHLLEFFVGMYRAIIVLYILRKCVLNIFTMVLTYIM